MEQTPFGQHLPERRRTSSDRAGRPVPTHWNEDAGVLSVLAVAGAALCYGASTVFQAAAVARSGRTDLTGLVGRLAVDVRYLSGLLLVALGFLLSVLAIRALPLFVVQAGRASSLGVTAVLATLALGIRLRRRGGLGAGGRDLPSVESPSAWSWWRSRRARRVPPTCPKPCDGWSWRLRPDWPPSPSPPPAPARRPRQPPSSRSWRGAASGCSRWPRASSVRSRCPAC